MFDFSLPDARQKILNGHRIVPVMSPDDSLAKHYVNPLPEYEESYPLGHIVLKGDDFWGITNGTNQPYKMSEGMAPAVTLGYTNSGPLYLSMSARTMLDVLGDEKHSINICSLRQYKSFRFHSREDAQLVWDGTAPQDFTGLRKAIADGSYYRLVFEDQSGLVFSLGVDLPMYFPGKNTLMINTHPTFFPEFFGDPLSLLNALKEANSPLLDPDASAGGAARPVVKVVGGFFSLRSDGTFFSVNGILSGQATPWQQARLYAY